jgi:hypothetical protein
MANLTGKVAIVTGGSGGIVSAADNDVTAVMIGEMMADKLKSVNGVPV